MNRLSKLVLVSLSLGLAGCATTRPKPPPLQSYRLGMLRADFRDYRQGNICNAEPRWLRDELGAPMAIVDRFVRTASASVEEDWSAADLKFVQEGARTLLPFLEVVEANLAAVGTCSFRDQPGFPPLVRTGPARCESARRLVAQVPAIVAYLQARHARELWLAGRIARGSHAFQRCEGQTPTIYYGVSGCDGAQLWQFCDGARVTRLSGKEPVWIPSVAHLTSPAPARRGKKTLVLTGDTYLAAVKEFQEVDRCPVLPPAPEVEPGAVATQP